MYFMDFIGLLGHTCALMHMSGERSEQLKDFSWHKSTMATALDSVGLRGQIRGKKLPFKSINVHETIHQKVPT
jgi:hypothetical protein